MRFTADNPAYIEHPASVPTRLCAASTRDWPVMDLVTRGHGGVCIRSPMGYRPGTVLEVRVRIGDVEYGYRGQVLWRSRQSAASYELGLAFASHDSAFHARMVEQLCHIEAFRRHQCQDGQEIDLERAARIWISRHSNRFPQIGGVATTSVGRRKAQPAVTVN